MYKIECLDIENDNKYEKIISRVLEKCFEIEQLLDEKFIVSVTLTNPENIKLLNKKYRNIDKSTDVLSFPMFDKEEIDKIRKNLNIQYNDILGDMVISIEQVKIQAKEYGHSFERELSYMVVHSFYHLLGYDHMSEDEKKVMREKEEYVLEKLNITRK